MYQSSLGSVLVGLRQKEDVASDFLSSFFLMTFLTPETQFFVGGATKGALHVMILHHKNSGLVMVSVTNDGVSKKSLT